MQELSDVQSIIAGGIIAVLLSELFIGIRVRDLLKSHVSNSDASHKELFGDHNNLSKEHSNLSKEHTGMLSELKNYIIDKTTATNNILLDEKRNQEFRYNNLNEGQKVLVNSISTLQNFVIEFERVVSENKQLNEKITVLNMDKAEMAAKIRYLNNQLYNYDRDDDLEI